MTIEDVLHVSIENVRMCGLCIIINNQLRGSNMFTQGNLMSLGIAAGILFAGYKFAPNPALKAMVLGVAGVVVAKNTPVLNTYLPV